MRVEPASLASKPLRATGISVAHAVRLFNAGLDLEDARENSHPYLAEALPQLKTDSWRVFPDGRMELTYRLKPNLTWHDGMPLAAEDFSFAYSVYANPNFGQAGSPPFSQMEDVLALDARTILIRWRGLYPDAAELGLDFQALPRHILEQPLHQDDGDAFVNLPFWGTEYIGLGPYRLARWEPGALIEGTAFEGHVLGRPKIDRIIVRFMADENTVLSNLLAGEIQFATDRTVRFEQASHLKREWGTTGGTPILSPIQPRFTVVQLRPEYANPRAILDVRVRRALAHAIDRQAFNDGLFNGEGVTTETHLTRQAPYFAELDRTMVHYPYDVRRTDQLMAEAGYAKTDGAFVNVPTGSGRPAERDASGERLSMGFLQEAGGQTEREMSIQIGTWRSAGFDIQVAVLPSTQLRDGQARSTFATFYNSAASPALKAGERNLGNLSSAAIGSPANRWRGSNYGGWSNSEYDRLWDAFNTTLERAERNRQVVDMARLASEHLPIFNLYWNFNVSAHSAALRGLDPQAIDTLVNWNVYEWEMS
jgi:peptide/nickel transport system substrate-binding protein